MKKELSLSISSSHPVISGHTINGHQVLPGLAYIDMIFQLICEEFSCEFQTIHLNRVSIFNPLVFADGDGADLQINLIDKEDFWSINVYLLNRPSNNLDSSKHLLVKAEINFLEIDLHGFINVEDVCNRALKTVDIDNVYRKCRNNGLIHSGIMKAIGNVYLDQEGCLIDLKVDEKNINKNMPILFHPVLIDGAAIAAMAMNENHNTDEPLFIPLYYESFRCREKIDRYCVVRVKRADVHLVNDIRKMDMYFYNGNGNLIAELLGLTSKMVRDGSIFSEPVSNFKSTYSESFGNAAGTKKVQSISYGADSLIDEIKNIFRQFVSSNTGSIDWSASFYEMGFESRQLMSIMERLELHFNQKFSPTLLFEYNNVSQLSRFIASRIVNHQKEDLIFQRSSEVERIVAQDLEKEMSIHIPCEFKSLTFIGEEFPNASMDTRITFGENNTFKVENFTSSTTKNLICNGQFSSLADIKSDRVDIAAIISSSHHVDRGVVEGGYRKIDNYYNRSVERLISDIYLHESGINIFDVSAKKHNPESIFYDDNLLFSALSVCEKTQSGTNGIRVSVFKPLKVESIKLFKALSETAFIVCSHRQKGNKSRFLDLHLYTENGQIVAEIQSVNVVKIGEYSQQNPQRREINTSIVNLTGRDTDVGVAIIGLAGRYPKSYDLEEFWNNLRDGVDCVVEIPEERWNWKEFYNGDVSKEGYHHSKWGGFIDDEDKFDALFFNISPREAELIDPQERIFLEHAWQAVEDAGYNPKCLASSSFEKEALRTGVYAGVMYSEYQLYGVEASLLSDKGEGFAKVSGSIANRVSYVMDLQGPSLTIDTMCSSSLTSLHLACKDLKFGEVDLAIAGGVNLSLHPNKYQMLSSGRMISVRGRCESFGDKGAGYTPGEGVGVAILKRLPDAERDGDRIYGVIRGSAINHGGKTSGYTVPSPGSQGDVIAQAIKNATVDPRQINYIEAHGTGTKIGDVIEIEGLTKALGNTLNTQTCLVGSAKSNFGHCESAAGIAGLTKVLMQLKHKEIAPSLHSATLNPNIDFDKTPFVVNQKLTTWNRPIIDGIEFPRVAGISSFGAGGSNAHIIVEEYVDPLNSVDQINPRRKNPVAIILSARTDERLLAYASGLLRIIERITLNQSANFSENYLESLAYTLQVGREPMPCRLGLVVDDLEALLDRLREVETSKFDGPGVFRGNIKKDFNHENLIDDDLISKENVTQLISFWIKGKEFDWSKLYGSDQPKRVLAPTYPFERKRHWFNRPKITSSKLNSRDKQSKLHPLLHNNISTLKVQKFQSIFSGEEYVLADHRVNGDKILPGVAYIEMACEAFYQTSPNSLRLNLCLHICDIVWSSPYMSLTDECDQVTSVELQPESMISVSFVISSSCLNDSAAKMHCQGRAYLTEKKKYPALNIIEIKKQCAVHEISSRECYKLFSSLGFDYGKTFQTIEFLYIGKNQVLARVTLPKESDIDSYNLPPSIMDAALQATIGFDIEGLKRSNNSSESNQVSLPYAVDKVEIIEKIRCRKLWAWSRVREGNKKDNNIRKMDIDLCDDDGEVLVKIIGFSTRLLKTISTNKNEITTPTLETGLPSENLHTLIPRWVPITIHIPKGLSDIDGSGCRVVLIVGGTKEQVNQINGYYANAIILELSPSVKQESIQEKLRKHDAINSIYWFANQSEAESVSVSQDGANVYSLFNLVKALLNLGYDAKSLNWYLFTYQSLVLPGDRESNPSYVSLHGFMGSVSKEIPHWQVHRFDLERNNRFPLTQCLALPPSKLFAYRKGGWLTESLSRVSIPDHVKQTPYKEAGVYVVIGGASGIGEAWSEWMVRCFNAKVVWIGRRQVDERIQSKIDALGKLGSAPIYIQADASKLDSLNSAYKKIKSKFNNIRGVIHSAIDLKDAAIFNMDEERFRAGLSAKIDISLNLAEVFSGEKLDFVLFFSSIISFIQSAGQSNYAAGCLFKDNFAHHLSLQFSCPVKVINWGYWGRIGSVSDDFYRQRMASFGFGSIEINEGLEAIEKLISGPLNQLVLVKTIDNGAVNNIFHNISDEKISVSWSDVESRIPEKINLQRDKKIEYGITDKISFDSNMENLILEILLHCCLSYINDDRTLNEIYKRWLKQSLAVLEAAGSVYQSNEKWVVKSGKTPNIDILWSKWEEHRDSWLQDPETRSQLLLMEACLKNTSKILKGDVPATSVIFPDGTMDLVEGVYKGTKVSDYFNDCLCDTLETIIEQKLKHNPIEKIAILEVGAGTGGTTAPVLSRLSKCADHIGEYCYTDRSKAFLINAKVRFESIAPYLQTKQFDVEISPEKQALTCEKYDVLIAANVLHATRDIRTTLENCKVLLKSDGVILLNEISEKSLFTHLTFGLLEGWWIHEDSSLRIPGSPGLYPDAWKYSLERSGYKNISFPASNSHYLGQQIIAAQSNGVICQKSIHEAVNPSNSQRNLNIAHLNNYKFENGKKMENKQGKFNIKDRAKQYFKILVADTLKMEVEEIDASQPLDNYGLDSILVVQLTNVLRKNFEEVSSTLFFEVRTIDKLVEHMIEKQYDRLISVLDVTGYDDIPTISAISSSSEIYQEMSDNLHRFSVLSHPELEKQYAHRIQDIAIIGLSGRYPEAENIDEFWRNLKTGKNCISEIPAERWNWKDYYDPEKGKAGKIYTKWGGFIKDADKFDPMFFGISPREAKGMDPQERVFLEESYKCIQDAGYMPHTLSEGNSIGVFVGVMNSTYNLQPTHWSIANRVSYLFNFNGPSMAVDTACSSSLTAIHLALESLYSGSCKCAIAGGVNIIVRPDHYLGLSAMTMLSSADKCCAFGSEADGFVDGEGVGAVILKPLDKAIEDRDNIYGLIKGSMVNAGGKTHGFTVPNPNAQADLIYGAMRRAGLDARRVSYIEAHGTGTVLGDPIEITGLTRAFEQFSYDKQYCSVGSVKTNIGHCESAAGIAGLTKVLMQMRHRQIVPSLNAETLNKNINFNHTPFIVNTALNEWQSPIIDGTVHPRVAGISSFGAGGANASVFVEEFSYPDKSFETDLRKPSLIVLSARTREQLETYAVSIRQFLDAAEQSKTRLTDIAYTLQVGREAMDHRVAFIATTVNQAIEKLSAFIEGQKNIAEFYVGNNQNSSDALSMFSQDEDVAEVVGLWLKKGKYNQLLEFWVKGFNVDWNQFNSATQASRISLPTYPFKKERYWIDLPVAARVSESSVYVESSLVEAYDYSGGVFALMILDQKGENVLSDNLINEIENCLNQIAEYDSAKIVLLMGTDTHFLTGSISGELSDKQKTFSQFILNFKLPLIAVVKGICSDLGVLVASACDFMVCNIDIVLRFKSQKEFHLENAYNYFVQRFNISCAQKLITRGYINGSELYNSKLAIACIDKERIDDYSINMARQISDAEKMPLLLLKSELSLHLNPAISAVFDGSGGVFQKQVIDETKIDKINVDVSEEWEIDLSMEELKNSSKFIPFSSDAVHLEEFGGGIIRIHLCDRENKNTFSPALASGISKAFQYVRESSLYKVVILTGYEQFFACGGTKKALLAIQKGEAKFSDIDIYALAMSCEIPVIAAMQGHAIGAGWSLALFADYVIYSEESVYLSPYMRYGFTPGAGATLIFPERYGLDFSREVLMGAVEYKGIDIKERVSDALVFPRSQVEERSFRLALSLSRKDRASLVSEKLKRTEVIRLRLKETYRSELGMHDKCFVKNDAVKRRIEDRFSDNEIIMPNIKDNKAAVSKSKSTQFCEVKLDSIQKGLRASFSDELHMSVSAVDDRKQFIDMGLDSITGVTWVRKINSEFGLSLPATIVYSYPTIIEFSKHIQEEIYQRANNQIETKISSVSNELKVENKAQYAPPVLIYPVRNLSAFNVEKALNIEQQKTATTKIEKPLKIAVIGMAGQFPKSRTLGEYWDNLVNARDCVSEIPPERWNVEDYFDEDPLTPGKTHCKWMGCLDDVALFDPLFFNISPLEAKGMDPQQRLFLQTAWECVEDSGYSPSSLSGSNCGVFVGCATNDYGHLMGRDVLSAQGMVGGSTSILAARISYVLNLQGPCISIDTACSSSLVAIATACDNLVQGNSDLAIAGGVCVMAGPGMHIMASKAGMLSKDGRCFTFDQRANGFVPGEGVGALLLKRLEDAERDKDRIHGVVSGWGINQDGKTNGITAPNPESQARLEKTVYDRFSINPEDIQLIEAHGTGTSLGDPIEIEGLKKAFSHYTTKQNYCALGSVKSNIGHLLPAAGVAGSIKLLLAIKHKKVPPSIHHKNLNEHIDLAGTPFFVNRELRDWVPDDGQVRRSAISAFGFGGTNAHLIIEEHARKNVEQVNPIKTVNDKKQTIILLSAKNKDRLKAYATKLLHFVTQNGQATDNTFLQELAYTLQIGRDAMEERLAIITDSIPLLTEKLTSFVEGKADIEDLHTGQSKKNEDTLSMFEEDEELQNTATKWLENNEFNKLAKLWVKGVQFDWNMMYHGVTPWRISVPTYPFANEYYWVESTKDESARITSSNMIERIHPLVHTNVSTFSAQRYFSQFIKNEDIASGLIVHHENFVPPFIYLEMAHEAVARATNNEGKGSGYYLSEIAFSKPLMWDKETLDLSVELVSNQLGDIAFQVISQREKEAKVQIQGVARKVSEQKRKRADTKSLKLAVCKNSSKQDIYRNLEKYDIYYDKRYQVIQSLQFNESEFIAEISVELSKGSVKDNYAISPLSICASLQAMQFLACQSQAALRTIRGLERVQSLRPNLVVSSIHAKRVQKNDSTGIEVWDVDFYLPNGDLAMEVSGLMVSDWNASSKSVIHQGVRSNPTHVTEQIIDKEEVILFDLPRVKAQIKDLPISLMNPGSLERNFDVQTNKPEMLELQSAENVLSWLNPQQSGTVFSASRAFELLHYGNGIYAIRSSKSDQSHLETPSRLLELEACIKNVSERSDAKVLLLRGNEKFFLFPNESNTLTCINGVTRLLALKSKIPLISIISGKVHELGLLLAALSDLTVWSEETSVMCPTAITDKKCRDALSNVLANRFNKEISIQLFMEGNHFNPNQIKAMGANIHICSEKKLHASGFLIAERLSGMPKVSLELLKSSLAPNFSDDVDNNKKDKNIIADYCHAKSKQVDITNKIEVQKEVSLASHVVRLSELEGDIACIELRDKASKNTFSHEFISGIKLAFEHINSSSTYKVVVLTGFDHYFACGGTKAGLLAIQEGEVQFTDINIYAIALECELPVIAAMQGHGIGAGWSLGMFCDYHIYGAESVYLSPYMNYGFTPGAGSTLIFPERLGWDLSRDILFTANEFKGADLKERGVRSLVLPRKEVLGYALAIAKELARDSRKDLIDLKARSAESIRNRLQQVYDREVDMHESSFVGNEEVLQRIHSEFNEGIQSLSVAQSEEEGNECGKNVQESALEQIKLYLKSSFSNELHLNESLIEEETPFTEMGLDSITGVTWVRKINKEYGLDIPTTKVYNHPTIKSFSTFILREATSSGFFSSAPAVRAGEKIKNQKEEPTVCVTDDFDNLVPFNAELESDDKSTKVASSVRQPIAIVGMAGQFPKAKNIEEYWDNLVEGKDCISAIPRSRWDIEEYYDPYINSPGKTNCRWMGILEDADKFDPRFFSISPREAYSMDPQQRLFLESVWQCIEEAGYNPKTLSGSNCGVFVGCTTNDYGSGDGSKKANAQRFTGGATSILAGRISYVLDLHGPCLSIDTACSSSLVAIASACDSLVLKNSDLALAGGVCVMAGPGLHIMTSEAGMLSKDGRCFSFDHRANGFVPGEGVGVVLLKRLSDAQNEGDHIHGIIRGWGVNQDGKTNGITAPNQDSQARLEKRIYEDYGINPEDIQLVEAHGTGTQLGDPIEVEGLKDSFSLFTKKENYCALGSVKSNVGHLLTAAGVASVIKVLLSMRYQKIPPTVHYEKLNENIDLSDSPFYINSEVRDWSVESGQRRMAAISSFGFSGTNSHLVIEEGAKAIQPRRNNLARPLVFVLSAKTLERLKVYSCKLLDYIDKNNNICLESLAYTLQVGRLALEERMAIVAATRNELKEKLNEFIFNNTAIVNTGNEYIGLPKEKIRPVQVEIETAYKNEDMVSLSKYWVLGYNVDWSEIYKKANPKRVSAPTYPFSRESYWLRDGDAETSDPERSYKSYEDILDDLLSEKIDIEEAAKLTVEL